MLSVAVVYQTVQLHGKKTFILGPNASFDEGGIPMRSRFCPVRQYNKDKPAKYKVDFFLFWLTHMTILFIIWMYTKAKIKPT